jgi:hypothetical protein
MFGLLVVSSFAEPASSASDVSPPAAPFVSEPAVGTKWVITLKYPKKNSPGTTEAPGRQSAPRASTIECQRGLSGTRITVKDAQNAPISEGFLVGNHVLKTNTAGSVSILPSDAENFASPIFVPGYQGTEWVSLDTYKGVEKTGKETCYKFVKPARLVSDASEGFSHPELAAWIQVGSQIPARVKIGDVTYSFSSIEPATPDIDMPPEIRRAAEKLQLEQRALDLQKN